MTDSVDCSMRSTVRAPSNNTGVRSGDAMEFTTVNTEEIDTGTNLKGINVPLLVEGESGATLELPCDVTPPEGDRVAVILWYRDKRQEAVYTYDARNASLAFRHHTPRDPSLQSRASFHPRPPAHLTIYHARPSDAGYYQCRVDFVAAPSKTTFLKVQVFSQPESIHLEDSRGSLLGESMNSVLGNSLVLSCIVKGGIPQPHVWWTLSGELVEGSKKTLSNGITRSDLNLSRLSRNHHEMLFGCHASSTNSTGPLESFVIILLNMPPLNVQVSTLNPSVESGHRYRVFCDVSGSYPPPEVTWSITRRGRHPEVLSKEAWTGLTEGRWWVEQVAAWTDDGAQVGCSASSPALPHLSLHNTTVLSVHYAPRLKLGLGEHLNPSEILEGTDVYFICSVESNPSAYKISWYLEDKEIHSNSTSNILVSNNHLVIQKVSREWTGEYTCRGSNVVGDTASNKLNVTIRFAPVCADDKHEVYEAALGEEIFLPCKVLAFPTNVTFYWTFANSVTQERLSQERVGWSGLESILRYHAVTLQDYGTLQCWAANGAGQQKIPCALSLRPAGAPSPPSNCSVSNQTWDTLEVTCHPPKIGYSRYISKEIAKESTLTKIMGKEFGSEVKTDPWIRSDDIMFMLTVYERDSMTVVYNKTGANGVFLIKSLSSGLDYLITVSRFNSRGRSAEITLEALTLRAAENRMKPNEDPLSSWFVTTIGAAIGAAIALVAMVIALVILLRKTGNSRERYNRQSQKEEQSVQIRGSPPDLLDPKNGNFTTASTSSGTICADNDKKTDPGSSELKGEAQIHQTVILPSPNERKSPPSQLQARDLQIQIQSIPPTQVLPLPYSSSGHLPPMPRSMSGLSYQGSLESQHEDFFKEPYREKDFDAVGRRQTNIVDKLTYVRRGDPQVERESFL